MSAAPFSLYPFFILYCSVLGNKELEGI